MIRQPADIRSTIIPYGNCLPGSPYAPVFGQIEAGDTTESAIATAQSACQTCPQLTNCKEQRADIATEFWRQGAGLPFIVDRLVETEQEPLGERPLQPATFKFDLSRVPDNPDQQLTILRQGVRTQQLSLAGPGKSEGIKQIADEYIATLGPDTERVQQHLGGRNGLVRAVQRIVRIKFLQIDFANRDQLGTAHSNYDPGDFDLIKHHDLIGSFLEDAIIVASLGLKVPDKKVTVFDPALYANLHDRYVNAELTPAIFESILTSNPLKPVASLDTYKLNLHRLRSEARQKSVYVRESALRQAARLGHELPTTDDASEQTELPAYVTPHVVRTLRAQRPGSQDTALTDFISRVESARPQHEAQGVPTSDIVQIVLTNPQSYTGVLERYSHNLTQLTEAYGQHPDFTESYLRRLARAYPDAISEARDYLSRLAILRSGADGTESASALKRCAQAGIDSVGAMRREVHLTRTGDKFAARQKRKPEIIRPDRWMLEKITMLYPRWEWDKASEGLFELINNKLVVGNGADFDLLTKDLQAFEKVCHDKQKVHVTFGAIAQKLQPLDRLAIAEVFHLAPLIYGQEVSSLALEFGLGVSDLNTYVADLIHASHQDQLATMAPASEPLTFSTLYQDLERYRSLILSNQQASHSVDVVKQFTTVIGAEAISLSDQAHAASNTLPGWLEAAIRTTYPPDQQGLARVHVKNALRAGIVSTTDNAGNQRLTLGPALSLFDLSDKERAIATYAYGVDRLLYNQDLGPIVSQRVTPQAIIMAIRRASTPAISVLPPPAKTPPKHKVTRQKTTVTPSANTVPIADKQPWSLQAACKDHDPLLFDPPESWDEADRRQNIEMAKAVCSGCAVRESCLEIALETKNEYGVWGGLTPKERASEQRKRRRMAKKLAARVPIE